MRSKTLLVAGIGAALISLAGCGGGTVSGSAQPQGATGGSGGGSSSSSQKISTVSELGALVQHNASGKTSAHINMSMNMTGLGAITATGDMKFAGTQSAEHMTMTMPGIGDMEMIMIGTTSYLKLPSGLAGMTGGDSGKPWVKIDLGGDSALAQSLGSTADLADETDPTQLISKIAQAGMITNISHDTVDGQPTTHYSITVDVQKMLATMGAGSADEKQAMSQLGLKSMPFDIWVNSDNLPVKITTDLAMSGLGASAGGSGAATQVDMTVTYTNWGESVNIQAPPADQVGTMGGN